LNTFETGVLMYWAKAKLRFYVEYFKLLLEAFEQAFPESMAIVKNIRNDNENKWRPVDLIGSQDIFLFHVYFLVVCNLVFLFEIFLKSSLSHTHTQ